MRDRKGLDLDRRGREQLGGVGREEIIIRKYNVRKKNYFNKRGKSTREYILNTMISLSCDHYVIYYNI